MLQNNHLTKIQKRIESRLSRKQTRKKIIRYALVVGNFIILLLLILFVVLRPPLSNATSLSIGHTTASAAVIPGITSPLDQLSSADIALSVSRVSGLPESTAVKNQSESVNAELAIAPTDSSIATKPQLVSTALKSRDDIHSYVTQPGDTVAMIATKFGVTSDSIRWSNENVNTSALTAGEKLVVPPISGVVYQVKAGDTPQSLAQKYNANAAQLIAYNDAEIDGIHPGEQIIIPNGQKPTAPTYNFYANYGSNGYDFGYCTYYVASQISVPSNWGNASSWAFYAGLSGWTVSATPQVGAIAQTPYAAGGEGHVAVVDAVSADGTMIQFRDMNGIAGWGRVGYSGWVPATTYLHYIYH